MDTLQTFILIGVAALIHASFQLSVSILTLLSSHTLGKKRSHTALLRLIGNYIAGAVLMTVLLISATILATINIFSGNGIPAEVWAGACGLLMGLGIVVWLFYYRKGAGTELWLPRGLAQYLHDRVKKTSRPSEAFALGLSGVMAELLFLIGPLFVSALLLIELSPLWQLAGIGFYAIVASLPLLIIGALIGGGHSIGSIQKWRENNKRFLQFIAGAALIVLGFYLYVDQISLVLLYSVR